MSGEDEVLVIINANKPEDEAEVLPGSWLVLAGINTIAHLVHHGKKGFTILAEHAESIASLWLWSSLVA